METIKMNILNPKVHNILKNLEDLGLISIASSEKVSWQDVLSNIRDNTKDSPSIDEITKGVEAIRSIRYEKKK
jgi:saccharopine dehydrogenase-like NADP-dependent oxidoreductase